MSPFDYEYGANQNEPRMKAVQRGVNLMHDALTEIYMADSDGEALRSLAGYLAQFMDHSTPLTRATASAISEGMAMVLLPHLIEILSKPPFIGSGPGKLLDEASVKFWGNSGQIDTHTGIIHQCHSCGMKQAKPFSKGRATIKLQDALSVAEIELCDDCNIAFVDGDKYEAVRIANRVLQKQAELFDSDIPF